MLCTFNFISLGQSFFNSAKSLSPKPGNDWINYRNIEKTADRSALITTTVFGNKDIVRASGISIMVGWPVTAWTVELKYASMEQARTKTTPSVLWTNVKPLIGNCCLFFSWVGASGLFQAIYNTYKNRNWKLAWNNK